MLLKLVLNNEAHFLYTNESIDLKALLNFIENKFKNLPEKYAIIYKYGNNNVCVLMRKKTWQFF